MASIVILIIIVGGLFLLRSLGFLRQLSFSWDFIWRLLLYILLALGVLGLLSKIWSIIVVLAHLPARWLISPSQNPLIDIVSTIILAAALYGIWRWRKWGAYLVLFRLAFTVFIQVFVYHSLNWQLVASYTGSDNLLADLSGAILWLWAFSRTWKYFK